MIPKILAVDDNPVMLRNIRQLLVSKYDVSIATSGESALKMLNNIDFDLVLLDYEMPGMSGKDVFMEMKNQPALAQIPVIFLTGIADKDKVMEVVTERPAGYVLKPIDRDILVSKIDKALEGKTY